MHCGLTFSDEEAGSGFSDFDEDEEDEDEEPDSEDEDSLYEGYPGGLRVMRGLGLGGGLMHDYDSELNTEEEEEVRLGNIRNPRIGLWYSEAEDDESGDDEEEEDEDEEGEFDSFIDPRPESEIHAAAEELDDTDISIPYHTRENNYYTQTTSDTPHDEEEDDDEVYSEEEDGEEQDEEDYKVQETLRGPVRPQRRGRAILSAEPSEPSEQDSDEMDSEDMDSQEEDSEASEDTVRGTARRFYVLQPRPARRRLIIGSDQE
jgi:hypothetical protein